MANYLSSFHSNQMDQIFGALSDATRRDILERLTISNLTVSEIAEPYHFALPTISKHLLVLEKAKLISKSKIGREYYVAFEPKTIQTIALYITFYTKYWNNELDNLENFLKKGR